MSYVYAKHFRELGEFTVVDIYKPYRSGGVKVDGKFIPRTFKYEEGKLKEQIYKDGGFVLSEFSDKTDRDFFKTYKKVFDVKVKLDKPIKIETTKKEVEELDEFIIKSLGSYKIQLMLKSDFDFDIPMDGEREKFDWEDAVFESLKGRKFAMKVTGSGMDTEYKVKLLSSDEPKEAPGFDDNSNNLPF